MVTLKRMTGDRRQALPFALALTGCLVASLLALPRAHACGVSAVDGSWSCSLAEYEEAQRPKWSVGANAVYTDTRLRFSDGLRAGAQRSAVLASLGYAPTPRLSLQASAGATLAGRLDIGTERHDMSAGPLIAIGASYRFLDRAPFLIATSTLSFSATKTRIASADADRVGYHAFDLRLGAMFGTTLWRTLRPYALARAFGGPVSWRYAGASVQGTDAYHYQLGAGLAVSITEHDSLFLEGSALGERALAGGVAFLF